MDSSYEKSIKKYEKFCKDHDDKIQIATDNAKNVDKENTKSKAQIINWLNYY
ncbi:hypothetical protein [Desulfurella sp.]|uniref:hypothetical protein n=1 Tax=Desulfurella sp. TaxID=1962857 RepID=UPI00257CD0E0|nr:hypothetical protein [Desulfurella sp.]